MSGANDKIDIEKIHPDLEPIDDAPSLFSFYGFGLGLYGNRDFSAESQSSIKTLFITLLYIPLIPIRAYRVVEGGGKYYFLGRAPVSKTARNGSIAAIFLGMIGATGYGIQEHVSSDKYLNGKLLEEADAAANQGELANAMEIYGKLFKNSVPYRQQARLGIRNVVRVEKLQNTTNTDFASILDTLNTFSKSPLKNGAEDVYQLALTRIKGNDATDNIGIHTLLHATETFNSEGEGLSNIDLQLVQTINVTDPTNLEAAVELSEIYYAQEDLAAVKTILAPVRDQLADTEAARILGQIYISEGNNNAAYPLLSSYTSGRLKTLQIAEKKFTDLQNNLWEGQYKFLNSGKAPQSFYDAYDDKSLMEQQPFVDKYIGDRINENLVYQESLTEYREASAIVPVVMDFGILQLRTAESMTSEATRNAELKAAEKTFLSIRNIVGDSDEYKIYLGQVYFWLGKQDEGQTLFDEILTANSRSANSLLSIASTVRSLGKVGLAAELALEAYANSQDDETRYSAANFMALFGNTVEERVSWLKRSDPKSTYVQASLRENQGHLATQKGDAKAAAKFYRAAIQHNESLPEDAVNYNNTALMYFSLHRVIGDKNAYQKGVDLMSKAVELRPDSSIMLSNAASTLVINSLYETLDDSIDYKYLQSQPSLSTISYSYRNSAEKSDLREKLRLHKDLQKAIDYLERSILLSPNNAQNYGELYSIYYFLDDKEAIADMADKMANNQIDVSATNTSYIDYVKDVDNSESLGKLKDREKFQTKLLTKRNLSEKTVGVLHNSLAENLIEQVKLGEFSAAIRAVEHAKKAVKNLPSSASQSNLTNALLTLASVEAAEKFPSYKALRAKSVKSLSDPTLIILMMGQSDEIANWLNSNANVKQAIGIESADYEKFPNLSAPASWALIKAGNPSLAKELGQNIRQSELRQSMQRIAEYTRPLSGGVLVSRHWLNQISNKPPITQSKFDELAEQGVPLPTQLFQ